MPTLQRELPRPRKGFWVTSGSLPQKTAASICTLWSHDRDRDLNFGRASRCTVSSMEGPFWVETFLRFQARRAWRLLFFQRALRGILMSRSKI